MVSVQEREHLCPHCTQQDVWVRQAVTLVLQQLLERAERPAGSRQQVYAQRTDCLLRLLPLLQQDGPVV